MVVALDVDEGERPGDSDTLTVVTLPMSTMMRILMMCASDYVRMSDDDVDWAGYAYAVDR